MKKLILASGSKRRYDILKNVGYEFDVIIPGVDEDLMGELPPSELVIKLSEMKARAVLSKACESSVILASDTVVELDNIILGKPEDKAHAASMLESLSGKTHRVYTGVCIIDAYSQREISFYEKCIVHMNTITHEQIHEYIETGQPMDKAGSYGIQGPGGLFVSAIEGDFFTVCGLPVSRVYEVLKSFGIAPRMKNVEYL